MGLTRVQEVMLRERAAEIARETKERKQRKWRKDYLNREGREEVMVMAAMAGKLDELIDLWDRIGRPKSLSGNAKRARYFVYQVLEEYLHGLPHGEVERVFRELQKCEIEVVRH